MIDNIVHIPVNLDYAKRGDPTTLAFLRQSAERRYAAKAFEFDIIKSAFEDRLLALLGEGFDYESIGWDSYDDSLEIYECSPNLRLSLEAQEFIFGEGFGRIYVNHSDGWETHYFGTPTLEPSRVNRSKEAKSASTDVRTCEDSESSSH